MSDPCFGQVRPDSEIEGALETAFLIGIKYLTGVNTAVRPESFHFDIKSLHNISPGNVYYTLGIFTYY